MEKFAKSPLVVAIRVTLVLLLLVSGVCPRLKLSLQPFRQEAQVSHPGGACLLASRVHARSLASGGGRDESKVDRTPHIRQYSLTKSQQHYLASSSHVMRSSWVRVVLHEQGTMAHELLVVQHCGSGH